MPDCMEKLVFEASTTVPSKNLLIGENCHIVAESDDGPRGNSILTQDDRNRYPNLILLCSNHHIVIDNDPDNWPVEKLHQIKSDHELWVETQLTEISPGDDFELKVYMDLVNFITEKLMLSKWDWLSDHAVRLLLYDEFVEGSDDVYFTIQKMVWPNKLPDIERSIINFSERLNTYIKHFLSNSRLREDMKWHVEDKTWKRTWRSDYHEYAQKSEEWQKKSTNLLFNTVVALNEYADSVRKYLNHKYMIYNGKFIVNDAMGVLSEMMPSFYIPDKYIEVD